MADEARGAALGAYRRNHRSNRRAGYIRSRYRARRNRLPPRSDCAVLVVVRDSSTLVQRCAFAASNEKRSEDSSSLQGLESCGKIESSEITIDGTPYDTH